MKEVLFRYDGEYYYFLEIWLQSKFEYVTTLVSLYQIFIILVEKMIGCFRYTIQYLDNKMAIFGGLFSMNN